jgi:hypothetical protein
MLQFNIVSLAAWNRDGIYVDRNGGTLSNTPVSADQLLYARAGADTSAPVGTLQYLGYAAIDATDGGMAIYATIDSTAYPYPATQSPYAFALTGGRQLLGLARTPNNAEPTGLSVISDQAIYVQGNYNSTRTLPAVPTSPGPEPSGAKQPAAIMADTLNVLSNLCLNPENFQIEKTERDSSSAIFDGTNRLNCTINSSKIDPDPLTYTDRDTDPNVTANVAPAFTAINSAFLAATDETLGSGNNNGGLNNYPRTHENWGLNAALFIRGSFVSLNYPVNVSGRLRGWPSRSPIIRQNDIFTPPVRLWDYDLDFNVASNLPPLTPTVRSIKQDVFVRQFNR